MAYRVEGFLTKKRLVEFWEWVQKLSASLSGLGAMGMGGYFLLGAYGSTQNTVVGVILVTSGAIVYFRGYVIVVAGWVGWIRRRRGRSSRLSLLDRVSQVEKESK